jgi:hypothetical protein
MGYLKGLGIVVASMLMATSIVLISGCTTMFLWNWFLSPIGLKVISYPQATTLWLIANFWFVYKVKLPSANDFILLDLDDLWEYSSKITRQKITYSGVVISIALILKLIIYGF